MSVCVSVCRTHGSSARRPTTHTYVWMFFVASLSIAFPLLLYLRHLLLVSLVWQNAVRFFFFGIRSTSTIIWMCRSHRDELAKSYIMFAKCVAPTSNITVSWWAEFMCACVTTPSSNYIRFFVCSLLLLLPFLNLQHHFPKILLLFNQQAEYRDARSNSIMKLVFFSNYRYTAQLMY